MKARISTATAMLALLLAGCGSEGEGTKQAANNGAPANAVQAPNGSDWSQTVSQTPEGGFVMGNPDAAVKLVEYGSMTCPHCAEFAKNGEPELIDNYVKSGRVSFEFRNFVRDPADIAVALLARCNGPAAFFKLTDQFFEAQQDWFGKLQSMTPEQQQQLSSLPPQQVTSVLAQQAGLLDFARVRGIPAAKAQQCLTNQAEFDRLVQMAQKAVADHPNFPGTPSFTINGTLVENAASWDALKPKLDEAVGG